jgi:hypothetical protein
LLHIWKIYDFKIEVVPFIINFSDKKIHEARAFNLTYRYIDDVLSINNSRFAEFLPLIYPPELEVKETTDTAYHMHEKLVYCCTYGKFMILKLKSSRLS